MNSMITVETFERIERRISETADQSYDVEPFEFDDPRYLIDGAFRNPLMRTLGRVCNQLLPPGEEAVQLPPDGGRFESLYTSNLASAELEDERARRLSVFVLRNIPHDMGAHLYTRLVVSEKPKADPGLLHAVPLAVAWGRPAGVWVSQSPLLYKDADPDGWQQVVTEVLDSLVAN